MRSILVEPVLLEKEAAEIENINTEVNAVVKQLYGAVELLKVSWQGADNTAFVNQILGYQDDFQRISLLMSQYIDFLRNSARAYRQTQQELAVQATSLTN